MKKRILSIFLCISSLSLVGCVASPTLTYEAESMGIELKLITDGKTGELQSEMSSFLGGETTSERFTIDSENGTIRTEDDQIYKYKFEGDKLIITNQKSEVDIKFTRVREK